MRRLIFGAIYLFAQIIKDFSCIGMRSACMIVNFMCQLDVDMESPNI
jgi:hypothetical protein